MRVPPPCRSTAVDPGVGHWRQQGETWCRPEEPLRQQVTRISRGSAEANDGARPGATDWKAHPPRARPERHRARPQRYRADHRLVSDSAWNAWALRTQSTVAGIGAAGGLTLTSTTSRATLQPGLTKARRYDGEYGAARRQPFGNSAWNLGGCFPVVAVNRNGLVGKGSPIHDANSAHFDPLSQMDRSEERRVGRERGGWRG